MGFLFWPVQHFRLIQDGTIHASPYIAVATGRPRFSLAGIAVKIPDMFATPTRDQAMALAGLFQSSILVYQLANQDSWDDAALLTSALSVLRLDVDAVVEVFGSADELSLGFRTMGQAFGGGLGHLSRDVFSYAVAMHQLGLKLDNLGHMTAEIQGRVGEMGRQYQSIIDDPATVDVDQETQLYEELAALYTKTISTLPPRILVNGSKNRLGNADIVIRVRSALFAGIRAAYLWHQLGGRRWQLMLQRRAYQAIAKRLA